MAANGYMSLEEVCDALGKSADQVKDLVSAGKLREIRDAGKVFFKKSEVEQIAAMEGSSVVDLDYAGASPEVISLDDNESFASALSNLADSSATLGALDESPEADGLPSIEPGERSGSSITFADDSSLTGAALNVDDIPEELPAAKPGAPKADWSSEIDLLPDDNEGSSATLSAVPDKASDFEDVPDLGLSGSSIISLEPSDSKIVDSPVAKEGTKAAKPGISVFDEDEIGIPSDPMGETQISSGVDDFDAVGSGSGLLDLTQESDDTSLGAELLDVISPTEAAETEVEAEVIDDDATVVGGGTAISMPSQQAAAAPMPTMAARVSTVEDPGTLMVNISLGIGILAMVIAGLAVIGAVQGVWPKTILGPIANGMVHYIVFGVLALLAIVPGIVAILQGRK